MADEATSATPQQPQDGTQGPATPPWGSTEEFNPEKAWALIQNLRADNTKVKSERDGFQKRVGEFEDKGKSELQRTTDKLTAAEERAATAELNATKLEVALEKAPDGMPIAKVRKLAKRLTGKTREEFEADAEELFGEFNDTPPADSGSGTRRPKERLRPGASQDSEPDEMDPAKLAARVPRLY